MNKLVRDLIPKIIAEEGKTPKFRIVTGDELKIAIARKLVEESKEVLEDVLAGNDPLEELGDLAAVMNAFIRVYKIEPMNLAIELQRKEKKAGGFDTGVFLEEIIDND